VSNRTATWDGTKKSIDEDGLVSVCASLVGDVLPQRYRTALGARYKLVTDLRSDDGSGLPVSERLRAFRHGFTTRLYNLYTLDNGTEPELYLNDIERRRAKFINPRPELLDNKYKFDRHLRESGFGEYLPELYGYISDGTFRSDQYASIAELVADEGRVVIKRYRGGAGKHVYICTDGPDGPTLRGKSDRAIPLDEQIDDSESYLVTEFCDQADYLDEIYARATNTIRLLTLKSDEEGVIFPAAVHRIGSTQTGVLDNFTQGGFSAAIDLDTGELSAAAEPAANQGVTWHDTHPDTGATIPGTTVPGWDSIQTEIRQIAREIDRFNHVGWDLIVTDHGEFKIIEANSYPNPDVLQVHAPLLANDDVRRFYRRHEII